ncbi:hypothetical protein [Chryseobacterium sp. SG20098]|uniref:hypothetical protein n=1 Tax=Chryseobacterium sp. SG20098 TaxID=3074145 RepID=UPI0028830D5A|nr:hypothetical protein [Chryseobacterium sp. SG20098]WNI39013.1 hypothetical protein RHP76_11055 [Chryseobacterium sp. SG20098]
MNQESKGFPEQERIIEEILKDVEVETGVNRLDFISNSGKRIYLEARKKAAKRLIVEAHMSDEGIAKVLGVSRSTANTYRNSLGFHRRY